MTIDATFWVAISFFIFCGGLIYLKLPQKINDSLTSEIKKIKEELDEALKIKNEAKNLLDNYENKIDKSKREVQEIINLAKKDSEKVVLEDTKKFHQLMENKRKNVDLKIAQMKKNALDDIKKISIQISMESVKHLIKHSIDKTKLDVLYTKNLEQTKFSLKNIKA